MSGQYTNRSSRERLPSGGQNNYQELKSKVSARGRQLPESLAKTYQNIRNSNYDQINSQDDVSSKGPFSPRHAHRVVHSPEMQPRRRLLNCPEEWVAHNHEHDLPHNVPKLKGLSDEEKSDMILTFIHRNQNDMWRYDPSYRDKSHHQIHDEIYNNKDFAPIMAKYANIEKKFKTNTSSEKVKACMYQGPDMNPVHEPKTDPFIWTLNTTRTSREDKLKSLFQPTLAQHVNIHPRGEVVDGEWRNFSTFVGHLRKNEMAMLKR